MLFEENIFKQKLRNILRNKRNNKIFSLANQNKNSLLLNSKDSNYSTKFKPNHSLIIQKLSRNNNNKLKQLFLRNESNKNTSSFFDLTTTKRQNLNINKILQSQINPYSTNKKNLSRTIYKKTNNINSFVRKTDLIVQNYFEQKEKVFPWKNPFKDYKEPLFIYEIIKFKKEKKQKTIIDLKKKNNNRTIFKKSNEIRFNKNNSLSYAHKKYINSLINKFEKDNILKNFKLIKREEKRKLYEVELKDKVDVPSIQAQKIKKLAYLDLTRETNIKEIINNEIFYKSLENRVNFIDDCLKLPTIKNKLIKYIISENYELKNLNAVDTKTLVFLNNLRFIIQMKKDKKKQLKQKFIKKESTIIDENNNINIKYEKNENENPIDKLDKEYLYNCQNYFSGKILSYRNVNISNNILINNTIFQKYKYIFQKKII